MSCMSFFLFMMFYFMLMWHDCTFLLSFYHFRISSFGIFTSAQIFSSAFSGIPFNYFSVICTINFKTYPQWLGNTYPFFFRSVVEGINATLPVTNFTLTASYLLFWFIFMSPSTAILVFFIGNYSVLYVTVHFYQSPATSPGGGGLA